MSIAQEKQIFLSALDLTSKVERDAYLAQACRDNPGLRQSVERLLAAHERQSNILDQSLQPMTEVRVMDILTMLGAPTEEDLTPPTERLGELIGNYRLLEKIGEGGFGEVYVAQQEQPVRRRVAIKLLKLGMNSKEILARFEAERQALAIMDHPNIAQIFDAGTTSAEQPFFAMELVRGVPITDFCEQQRLDIRQRIELFIDVCQAVQHAHQKGVIHRDLKPSNVMVTLHDAKPVAKVIDFGVAKAIGEPLTSKPIYTRFMQLIGTPMYMSPEQAEMNSLDVDTRCDVFSLGMILYELLTGTTPYDEHRLSTAQFDELRRIIREEELPRPSHRLSTLGKQETTVSQQRRTTASQLMVELRGDLDWIVMKAVEKNRSLRYETASAFAQDLRRYLDNEPIEARPPSRWYRFTKFARRHKVTITAASCVLLAMLIGTGFSLWQAARAVAERDAKELAREDADRARQEVENFTLRLREANILLTSARAHADVARWPEAAADYTRATEIQPKDYHVWIERGAFYIRMGLWKAAAEDYAQALELEPPIAGAEWWGVPQLMLYAGNETAYRSAALRMWNTSRDNADSSYGWAIRSCLFAERPFIDPTTLVEAAEQVNQRMKEFSHPELPRFEIPEVADETRGGNERTKDRTESKERGHHQRPPRSFSGFPPRRNSGALPPGIRLYLLGLAHYRQGNFEKAVETLVASQADSIGWSHNSISNPALAMAYFKLGQLDQAQSALLKTSNAIDEWTNSLLRIEIGTTPLPWFDYIECLLLYREATVLLTGNPPENDPRSIDLLIRSRAAIQ